jgi:hypothetical protein
MVPDLPSSVGCSSPHKIAFLTITGENIDVMALSGRESLIYSYDDVIPVGFLKLFSVIGCGMCFMVPFMLDFDWDSSSMAQKILPWLFVAFVSATGLTILGEISRLWMTFRRMNTYAWTLGIAREIDVLLQSQKGTRWKDRNNNLLEIDYRKHGYKTGYEEVYRNVGLEPPVTEQGCCCRS